MVNGVMRCLIFAIISIGCMCLGSLASAVPPPEPTANISVDSGSVGFGNVTVHSSSGAVTLTVTNNGNAGLEIDIVVINGTDPSEFTKSSDNCSSQTVQPASTCTVDVSFDPVAPLAKTAVLSIPSNDPDTPVFDVTLSGMGQPSTNSAPTAPVLEYPADGQTGVSLTVDFKWKESTDNDNDTLTYYLHYSDNQEFIGGTVDQVAFLGNKGIYFVYSGLGFLMMGMVFAAGEKRKRIIPLLIFMAILTGMLMVSCGGGGEDDFTPTPSDSVTQQVSGLSASTTYYWKVVADDGNGGVAESEVWSFTTQ